MRGMDSRTARTLTTFTGGRLPALLLYASALLACHNNTPGDTDGGKVLYAAPQEDLASLPYNPTFEADYNHLQAQPWVEPVTQSQTDDADVYPDRLEFPVSHTEVLTWHPGRLVVAAPGKGDGKNGMGFARRVTSVANSGKKIVVKTSAPAIEDILQGDFQMVLDPAKGTDVDVTKLDLQWAADNLFFNTPDVDNMPGELLTDDFPPDVVPMGFFSKVTKSIKNGLANPGGIVKSVQKAVVKAINAIIPDTISVAGSISPKIKINKKDDLFSWTGYKKTFTTKSGNNVELTIGGSGKYGAEVELQPGIQVGAKIGLPGQGASSQAWMNIDTRAQATVGADIALTATLSSVDGKLPGEIEEYLNSKVDKGQEVYNTFREKLLGDPDTKPQATWKNTLWISKPSYQTFFAGQVPVVVVETLQVDLECGFEAKAGITAHAEWTQNATFKFTAKYDSATNSATTTPPSVDKRHTYALSVLGAGEAMFTCGLVPRVNVFLYDTIGVFAGLRESLVARASYQTECPKMPTNNWPTATVKLGLAANVGIQVGGRFQAPGSSFFGKAGQKAGFDVGPLEVWNKEFPLITKKYEFSRGLGFCYSSCLNGRLDGDETDVDCGDQCALCAFGNKCAVNSDCADSSCINGICSLGTCGNKVQDGVETDIDCGGPACPKCADTKSCELGPDCASGFCTGKGATTPGVCVTDHCTDAVKDADEGGIDCSGATCAKCAVGVAVTKAPDCASGLWDGRACVATGIASIAPPTGVSTATTMITITGAGFQAGAMVSVGSLPCANPVVTPPTMITCIAPAQAAVCGSFPVTVTNPDGTAATAATRFSYVEVPGGPPVFGTVTALPSGMWPDGVLAVDMNGDGILDLVNANRNSNNVMLRLGKGDGSFGLPTSFAVGAHPIMLVVADMNGDRKKDVVVTNYNSGNVSVLLGDGMGGFAPAKNVGTGANPVSIAVGDLNGDNIPDVAIGENNSGYTRIMLGDGTGNLMTKVLVASGRNPQGVALINLDGDTKLDLVVSSRDDNNFSVFKGMGDGTVGPAQTTPTDVHCIQLVVADVNGDGKLDVAMACETGRVAVHLGDGMFGFTAAKLTTVGPSLYSIAAADLNGDKKVDLLAGSNLSPNLAMLVGAGDGSFTVSSVAIGANPLVVVTPTVGDFNGDGRLDVAATTTGVDTVSVLLQRKCDVSALATCKDVKQFVPGATDGNYTLNVGGDPAKPWTAFCKDIAGTPIEYLTLLNTTNANFSQYSAGGYSPGTDVRTAYTKLRLDPVTLAVDANDQTYSISAGMLLHSGTGAITSMPYGVAFDCVGSGSPTGVGNIDLTGTPFAVVGAQFSLGGAGPKGSATYGTANRTVNLTAGGACGWNAVTGSDNPYNKTGKPMQLVYVP